MENDTEKPIGQLLEEINAKERKARWFNIGIALLLIAGIISMVGLVTYATIGFQSASKKLDATTETLTSKSEELENKNMAVVELKKEVETLKMESPKVAELANTKKELSNTSERLKATNAMLENKNAAVANLEKQVKALREENPQSADIAKLKGDLELAKKERDRAIDGEKLAKASAQEKEVQLREVEGAVKRANISKEQKDSILKGIKIKRADVRPN